MGWSTRGTFRSRTQGAAARIWAMVSPPMPAMTTASVSSGRMPFRPSHRRKPILSRQPYSAAVSLARSRGPWRRSAAMAYGIFPSSSRAAGR